MSSVLGGMDAGRGASSGGVPDDPGRAAGDPVAVRVRGGEGSAFRNAPVVGGSLREDRPAGTGHRAGNRQYGAALDDHRGDAGSAAAGNRLYRASTSALGFGTSDRPVDHRTGDERRRGAPQRRTGPVNEATDGAARKAEGSGDLVVAGAIKRRADENVTLQCGERGHSGEGGPCPQALLYQLVDLGAGT